MLRIAYNAGGVNKSKNDNGQQAHNAKRRRLQDALLIRENCKVVSPESIILSGQPSVAEGLALTWLYHESRIECEQAGPFRDWIRTLTFDTALTYHARQGDPALVKMTGRRLPWKPPVR